jgi:hypothetical protein
LGRLLGLFPAQIKGWRKGSLPAITGWTHPYSPLGTPLVDRDQAEPVIAAWLDHLAADPAMPALLMLPLVPEQGAFARALDAVVTRSGRRAATFGRHQRALLQPGANGESYVERRVPTAKRKELRRQRRRLSEIAPVTFSSAADAGLVAAALQDFMVLEASGWKGIAQTAVANDPGVRRFVETAVAALAAQGQARVDRMLLDGRAVAAAVTLSAGDTAWFWKIAYGEGVARFSPGVQLVLEFTATLPAAAVARVDSCATADHPMNGHIWRERLSLCDRLIALKAPALPFGLLCLCESMRRGALGIAKSLHGRLSRRATTESSSGAQQAADHLAGGGHRHFLDKGDLARILVGGEPGADKPLDVGGQRL